MVSRRPTAPSSPLTPANFVLGVLSEAENKTIAAGLNDVVMDYLVDVVDRNGDDGVGVPQRIDQGRSRRTAGS